MAFDGLQAGRQRDRIRSGEREGVLMGMRRRSRRRGLVVGAAVGHHMATKSAERQQGSAEEYEEPAQAAPPPPPAPAAVVPPPADPADQIEHLAQLHTSGALSDDEFAAAKAKILGT
jgi:hypothetical protein